jgi:hypothetical protein
MGSRPLSVEMLVQVVFIYLLFLENFNDIVVLQEHVESLGIVDVCIIVCFNIFWRKVRENWREETFLKNFQTFFSARRRRHSIKDDGQ